MLILASLRSRWTDLVGAVVALAVGVALVAATGLVLAATLDAPARPPQRYATAPVVVTPVEEVRVATRHGVRAQALAVPHGLAPDVVARLATLGPVVVDRLVYAQLPAGGAGQVGRPWSAAAFGTHRLRTGRAPLADGEIVVWAGAAGPGQRVSVLTVDGAHPYTVVGVLAPARFERALFFTDAEAARLSPRVDALVLDAPPARVRALAGDDARVRSGARLRRLDPDAGRDAEALVAANALLGTVGGIAAFVSVFVVAATFAYAVTRRRRELALLRIAGATPGQVRRLVLAEGLVVAVLGAAGGCVAGRQVAPLLAARLVDAGFAPDWFAVPAARLPLVVAFVTGLGAALAGVCSAAWRAGRVRPAQALRESVAQTRAMPAWRWTVGLAVLAGALATLAGPVLLAPADLLKRKQNVPAVLLLVTALAVLAPALVPPLARLLGGPLTRLRGATGPIVVGNALVAARRTAATAAPVLLTVGLAACLLGLSATTQRAKDDEADARVPAGIVVRPDGSPGLNREVLARLRGLPGADVAVSYPSRLYDLEDGVALVRRQAQVVDPAWLAGLPVVAGSTADLRADTVVVDREWHRAVGDTVRVWRADGSPVTLRVVAVLREGVGGTGAFLTTGQPAAELAGAAVVRGAVDVGAVRAAVAGLGASVGTTDGPDGGGVKRTGVLVLLAVILLYAGLSVAGTMLMAARDRARDLHLLRLAGAGRRQVVLVVLAETVFVVALGVVLALIAAAVTLAATWLALLRLTGEPPVVVVPWGAVGAVTAAVTGVAVTTSMAPLLVGWLRRRGATRRTPRPGSRGSPAWHRP